MRKLSLREVTIATTTRIHKSGRTQLAQGTADTSSTHLHLLLLVVLLKLLKTKGLGRKVMCFPLPSHSGQGAQSSVLLKDSRESGRIGFPPHPHAMLWDSLKVCLG